MNRLLVILAVFVAGGLLIPDVAEAQRGGRGGGGARIGGGAFGGGAFGGRGFGGGGFRGGGFRGGNFAGPRMGIPTGSIGGFRGGAIAGRPGRVAGIAGPGGFRATAINNPGARFGNRYWGPGMRPPGTWGGRYPYYGARYPYYGARSPYYRARYPYYGGGYSWGYPLGLGLTAAAVIGAAATYPYYEDPYATPYYEDPYATSSTPISSSFGAYCVTPVRTCALVNSAPVGVGCSCSMPGGRARGTVQ